MPNKNDMSDLVEFFGVIFVIIFGLVLLLWNGVAWAEIKYGKEIRASVRMLDAKVSQFVWNKWNENSNVK